MLTIRPARTVALISLLAPVFAATAAEPPATAPAGAWVDVSTPLVKRLTDEGKKLGYPGQSAGVAADPVSGDVFLVIPGQGLWRSADQGKSFDRADGGAVGGRCETSYTINVDPAGGRLACFMLDGKCAQSADGGKTWLPFKDMGRNWDYAAVDWPADAPAAPAQNIFAAHHETGGKVHLSTDGGKSWKELFADPEFEKTGGLGVFDAATLVYTMKGKGIQRSTDAGQTWSQVSDVQPVGRVVRVFKDVAYWLAKDGVLVSRDRGATWTKQGTPVDVSVGPFFDPADDKRMTAAGPKGVYETKDGGQTWAHVAPLPPEYKLNRAGWFVNVAWDPKSGVFYASNMGKPAYRWEPARAGK